MEGVAIGHSHSPLTATSPKEYTISRPTGDVVIDQDLCSIMLKPASATRGGKGKTRWHQLDPGNQCITGKVFLDAIRAEAETKEREKEEKEGKKEKKQDLLKKRRKKQKKERKRKEMPRAKPKGRPAQKKKKIE